MLATQYAVRDGVFVQGIGDEVVVLSLQSGQYYSLNGVGALIWRMAESGAEADTIADAVVEEYDVDRERAISDTQQFLSSAVEYSLLVERMHPG